MERGGRRKFGGGGERAANEGDVHVLTVAL